MGPEEEFGNIPTYIQVYEYTWLSKTEVHLHPKCSANQYVPCSPSEQGSVYSIFPDQTIGLGPRVVLLSRRRQAIA